MSITMQAPFYRRAIGHTNSVIGQNVAMSKPHIRQVFADNVRKAMKRSEELRTQIPLAEKADISQGHLSELLNGHSSPTIDLVADLAQALGLLPWELMADSEATKQAALARMLWSEGVANEKVEQHYPLPPAPAPKKEAATRRRKKPSGNRGNNDPRSSA